jgi:CSLREA domain-containing protein
MNNLNLETAMIRPALVPATQTVRFSRNRHASGALARLMLVALLASAASAGAATIVVTRNDDPVPDTCVPGDCSLREAVAAANANVDPDLIQVPAGNYGLPRGKLTLTGNVQIFGYTDAITKVEGDGTFPVFDIVGAADVKLARMTIQGHGAHAIDAEPDANTILEFITVAENDSQIQVGGAANSNGSLSVRASEIHSIIDCGNIRDCRVQESSRIFRLKAGTSSATDMYVSITNSIIDGDLGVGDSGAVIATNGYVSVTDTTIQNTTLGLQVRLGIPALVVLDRIVYAGNAAPVDVGNAPPVTVVDSTFRDNISADVDGGPGALRAHGAADWTISGSTFSGNVGNGSVGGAVLVEDGAHVAILNSTFSGNTFSAAAASGARGAAIGFRSNVDITNLLLRHVTIVPPAFAPAGILGSALGGEGGESGLVLTVLNSVVRGTCSLDAGAMDTNLGNIESPGDTCDFGSGSNAVNVASSALDLGTLGHHGGLTQTYLPAATSMVMDTANPIYCLATDQRGYARPFGAGCDVGAVEVGADLLFANGFE